MAGYIDWAVVILFFLSGFLHPSTRDYYDSLWRVFLIIIIPLFSLAFLIYRFSEKYGNRIQGTRNKIPPIAREAFGSGLAMFVVACMASWPCGFIQSRFAYRISLDTDEMGLSWWMVILQMYAGIVAVDALTYWKHRLLHTRLLFPFHKDLIYYYRHPTPFASFARRAG